MSPERVPESEHLRSVLLDAVKAANEQDQNTVGVILYGSRTHSGQAKPYSDVDLMGVQTTSSYDSYFTLRDILAKALDSIGLKSDLKGFVYLEWFDTEGNIQPTKVGLMETSCQFLDKDSVFILTDPEAEKQIREFVHPELKVWSRETTID